MQTLVISFSRRQIFFFLSYLSIITAMHTFAYAWPMHWHMSAQASIQDFNMGQCLSYVGLTISLVH